MKSLKEASRGLCLRTGGGLVGTDGIQVTGSGRQRLSIQTKTNNRGAPRFDTQPRVLSTVRTFASLIIPDRYVASVFLLSLFIFLADQQHVFESRTLSLFVVQLWTLPLTAFPSPFSLGSPPRSTGKNGQFMGGYFSHLDTRVQNDS